MSQFSFSSVSTVVRIREASNDAVCKIKPSGDPNVSPNARSSFDWEVVHDGNDEPKKGKQVLNYKEFITQVAEWCQGRDIHPY